MNDTENNEQYLKTKITVDTKQFATAAGGKRVDYIELFGGSSATKRDGNKPCKYSALQSSTPESTAFITMSHTIASNLH